MCTRAATVVTESVRQMSHAASVEDIVGILVATVTELGGWTLVDGLNAPEALPLDLSMGTRSPMVPAAEPGSAARAALSTHLPRLIADARRAAERCRRIAAGAGDPQVPPGFEHRAVLRELLGKLAEGDAVLQLRFTTTEQVDERVDAGAVTASAADLTRSCSRAMDRCFLVSPQHFVVVLPQGDDGALSAVGERVHRAAAGRLPGMRVEISAVVVSQEGGVATYHRPTGRGSTSSAG